MSKMFIWQFTRKRRQRNPFMRSEMKFMVYDYWSGNRSEEFYEISWEGLDNDGNRLPDGDINLSFPTVHQPQVLRSRSWISKLKLIIHLQASRRVSPTMILRQEFSVPGRIIETEVECAGTYLSYTKDGETTQKKMEVCHSWKWIFQRFVIQLG